MITKGFIEKIRGAFDEFNINAPNGITYEEFEKQFIKTLNRSEEIIDAKLAITVYQYCTKKWKKIEKIFTKYLHLWQSYQFEGPSDIHTLSDEESQGSYYITNSLIKGYKNIFLTSSSLEDKVYQVQYKNGKYTLDRDNDFYIKKSNMNSTIMKLFDKKDNMLCNIVLSDNLEVFLEKNQTKYFLAIGEDEHENTFIGIFDKSYIDSLGDHDMVEFENMVADIQWDIVKKKSDLGIAKITLYKEVDDASMFLYFGMSTFLLYKAYNDSIKRNRFLFTGILTNCLYRK